MVKKLKKDLTNCTKCAIINTEKKEREKKIMKKVLKNLVYYIRKGISVFGFMSVGAYLAVGVECGFSKLIILGIPLGFALGVLANLDNEKFDENEENF